MKNIIINKNEYFKEYDSKTLKKIKKLELMILTEFIKICEENNIQYFLDGGTALGAIRHQGFIPWDDDIDVILLREDYDKLLKIMRNYESDKFEFISPTIQQYYTRFYSQLNLKGTHTERFYNTESADFDLGLSVEIFVLDNVPDGNFERKIFNIKYNLLRKLQFAYEVSFSDRYISKNKQRIGRVIGKIFKILGVDNNFVKRRWKSFIDKNNSKESKEVANLSTPYSTLNIIPRNIFKPPQKLKFESIMADIPKDYDTYLTGLYGNYMELPPVEKRVNHSFKVDFGKY